MVLSDYPVVSEAELLIISNDDVVVNLYAHESACKNKIARNLFVILAGLCGSRWMIVNEHERSGGMSKGNLDHLSRINLSGCQRSLGDFLDSQDMVLPIQEKDLEDLLLQVSHFLIEKLKDVTRRLHIGTILEPFSKIAFA